MDKTVEKSVAAEYEQVVDFDIRGVVRIRFFQPGETDIDAFALRSGAEVTKHDQEPDIVVRFVDAIAVPGMTYLGQNWAGFTNDNFYVLCRRTGRALAGIPFHRIGKQCEITTLRGGGLPLLFDIIRLTFMSKGLIALHASAFVYEGAGVLVLAWAKAGKTGVLLSFMNRGAQFVGDEWVMLTTDGKGMLAMPAPVEISEWQLKYLPNTPRLPLQKKILFGGIHLVDALGQRLASGALKDSFWVNTLMKATPALRRQLKIKIAPRALYGTPPLQSITPLHKILLIMKHSEMEISVQNAAATEVIERAVATNEFEMTPLFEYYQAFKFAFPGLRNRFLDDLPALQRSLLSRALQGKQVYTVSQPYPVPLDRLFGALEPTLTARDRHKTLEVS